MVIVDWQRIETAPRDGTEIFLARKPKKSKIFVPDDYCFAWDANAMHGMFPKSKPGIWRATRITLLRNSWVDSRESGPTHWAAVPAQETPNE